ncbi:hypothetical protein [Ekhidna sp.]|uniref:hypothetical protein n=1 Tax=Ekhidna sp. TaxID=2608089 RepID=UPI003297316A
MEQGVFYYIYNHANGSENLFRSDENYHFFLRQWAKYIEPVADTYAYCLMPNHFHALIQTKIFAPPFGKYETFQKYASKQFSNFFSSYTQAFNKMYDQRGSLFMPNFKRKEINSDAYLTQIITYIHKNPIHHGFCNSLDDWPYSSFHALLSTKPTKIKREKVLEWFGGQKAVKVCHLQNVHLTDKSLFIDY